MIAGKLPQPALLARHPITSGVKVLILAAKPGPRLGDGSERRPGSPVEIGVQPILRHSMMNFATRGFRDFLIALGYRGDVIKSHVSGSSRLQGDLHVNYGDTRADAVEGRSRECTAALVETGEETGSAGRITKEEFLGPSCQRLMRVRSLLDSGELDTNLRWRSAALSA